MVNLHTHTVRCGHASGSDREYIESVLKAGFREIGFSDHAPFLTSDGKFGFDFAKAEDYFTSLRKLRDEYRDRITIHIGYETEYHRGHWAETERWFTDLGCEYILLGQHVTMDENGEKSYPAQASESEYALQYYIDCCLSAVDSGKVTYVAHPDLMNFVGKRDIYEKRFGDFIDELNKLGIAGEYNRLGFYEHRNYPNDLFWQMAAEKQMKTVIGLDAHQPEVYLDSETVGRMRETAAAMKIHIEEPRLVQF